MGFYFEDIWASDCSYIAIEETPDLYLVHQILLQNAPSIRAMQKGVAQQHVYPKDLQRLEVIWPARNLIENFIDSVEPTYRQIENLQKMNTQLTKARDLLLPRLMDGRIPVDA